VRLLARDVPEPPGEHEAPAAGDALELYLAVLEDMLQLIVSVTVVIFPAHLKNLFAIFIDHFPNAMVTITQRDKGLVGEEEPRVFVPTVAASVPLRVDHALLALIDGHVLADIFLVSRFEAQLALEREHLLLEVVAVVAKHVDFLVFLFQLTDELADLAVLVSNTCDKL